MNKTIEVKELSNERVKIQLGNHVRLYKWNEAKIRSLEDGYLYPTKDKILGNSKKDWDIFTKLGTIIQVTEIVNDGCFVGRIYRKAGNPFDVIIPNCAVKEIK